jgi:integrase
LRRRITGIRSAHRRLGLIPPAAEGARKMIHELARRGQGTARPKRAVTLDELGRMVRGCDDSDVGLRDRALLLVGFASGLRRSELVALDVEDVRFDRRGIELRIRRSKTDQEGQGRVVAVFQGKRPATCPVRALRLWMRRCCGVTGALWIGFRGPECRPAGRLSAQGVREIVRKRASGVGICCDELGAHSLRAGCVTAAIEGGASLPAVMERTGHRSVGMLARYYRPASAWSADPLAGVL